MIPRVGLCLALAAGAVTEGAKTLAVLSSDAVKASHSKFFKALEERGHSITYKTVKDKTNDVYSYDERAYDNLVVMAPAATSLGGSLNVEKIMRFLDDGGNVLAAGAPNPGSVFVDLARYGGFQTDGSEATLVDFFNADAKDDGTATRVAVDVSGALEAVVGSVSAPILYKGTGFKQFRSQFSFPVAYAPSSSFLGTAGKSAPDRPISVGSDTIVVGAMQARNSARLLLVGSLDAMSDEYADATVTKDGKAVASGNAAFTLEAGKWTFREKAVLRGREVNVHTINPKAPGTYTVRDDVEYEIWVEQLQDGKWVPYNGRTDMQMQYTRMDPFEIKYLVPGADGEYSIKFRLPDVYGLFTFKVNYHRTGYTNLDLEHVEVIRPLRNTMHSRFLVGAYPYYISAFSMIGGIYILSFVFLYHKDGDQKQKKE